MPNRLEQTWFSWIRTDAVEIRAADMPATVAFDVWSKERSRFEQTHEWPIIVGSMQDVERREDYRTVLTEPPKDVIARGISLNIRELLTELSENCSFDFDEGESELFDLDADFHPSELVVQRKTFAPSALVGLEKSPVRLALVPVDACWEAPAVLGFGGWNECPEDAIHVAMLKHWYEKCGAEPVTMTGDILELFLPKPLANAETAKAVAFEQYPYCPDIVDQGTETIRSLAQEILGSHHWFFWWD